MAQFIFNKKIYDTQKSIKIAEGIRKWAEYNWIFGREIYPSRETALYKTSKGSYFFTSEKDYKYIAVLATEEQAKDWLMLADYAKYTELFGELEEG